MKKLYISAAMLLGVLAVNAQEKTMRVHNADNTYTLTRVSELSKISFLSIADKDRGVIVKTVNSEPVTVLFDKQPVISMEDGSMTVTSQSADSPVTIQINDISEIKFGTPTPTSITGTTVKGVTCELLPGAALFRGIADGVRPMVCTIDGRILSAPSCDGGEMRLSRENVGAGIFIVRIGTFTTKITL